MHSEYHRICIVKIEYGKINQRCFIKFSSEFNYFTGITCPTFMKQSLGKH